jgi:hypothetical protein
MEFSNKQPERKTAYNSTYKKLVVQCLNEALYFVSSSEVAGPCGASK